MFRRNKRTRKYQTPLVKEMPVVFESNFCATVRFNVQVKDLQNMNDPDDPMGVTEGADELFYFEP